MATFHIKVSVGRTISPKHSGIGAVLVTVITGTTYNAVQSGITSGTSTHYQIVGAIGDNDYWMVTGPSTVFAGISISHPFYSYVSSVQGISASTVATFTLTLGPRNVSAYMPKKYMYALQNSVLNPRNLGQMMENSDYQTTVTDRHYVTAIYCNNNYDRLKCYYSNDAELYSNKLCTGRNVGWNPSIAPVGSIYTYDPSIPAESYYPPWTVYFRTSSLVINNSTNRTLYVDFRLWVKQVGSTNRVVVGNVVDHIGPGSNSYNISYVATDWPDIGEFGFELANLKEDGEDTTNSLRVTLEANGGSNSISYYGPCVRTLSYPYYNSSTVVISSVALDFYT